MGKRDAGKLKIAGVPIPNAMWYLGMNVQSPPFNDVKVRQAVAYAIPYGQIMQATFHERGLPLYGATLGEPTSHAWPQPFPYQTDVERARQLMAEADMAAGFETTLSFDLGEGTVSEPTAVLIQEDLTQLHIKTMINKIPGSQWRGEMAKKSMPLLINRFGGWLDYPDYFFFWTYHGQNAVFSTMSYQNPELDKLIDAARVTDDPSALRPTPAPGDPHRHGRRAARPFMPTLARRGHAAVRHRLSVLVPSAAGFPAAQQGLTP